MTPMPVAASPTRPTRNVLPAKSHRAPRMPPDAQASLGTHTLPETAMTATDSSAAPDSARRRFLADLGAFALAAASAPLLQAQPRLADAADVRQWLQQVQSLSRRLRDGAIDSAQWRSEIDALAATTPLPEFLPQLQFDRALAALSRNGHDPVKTFVTL